MSTVEFIGRRTPAEGGLRAAGTVSLRGALEETAPEARSRLARARVLFSDHHLWQEAWLGVAIALSAGAIAWAALPAMAPGSGKAPSAAALKDARLKAALDAAQAAQASGQDQAPDGLANPEFQLQQLSPLEAQIFNSLIPVSESPNPPAKPFVLKGSTPQDELRAQDCLAAAVYYESASEPLEGQQAVAQVVLNRVRDPAYPKSVCGVVFDGSTLPTGWQFSFTGDGSLGRRPSAAGWARAQSVAFAALHGFVAKAVGQATHYHTVWVAPYWSPKLDKVANIGAHIFYRWLGSRGLPSAFTGEYLGVEPFLTQIAALDPAVTDAPVVMVSGPDAAIPEGAAAAEDAGKPAAQGVVELTQTPATTAAAAPVVLNQTIPTALPKPQPVTTPLLADPRPRTNARLPMGSGW